MIRDITIRAVLNGFVVTCGCQNLVFTDTDFMMKEISAYLKAPKSNEDRYLSDSLNAKHIDGPAGAQCEDTRREQSMGSALIPASEARRR